MVIQNGLVAFHLSAESATGILESYMSKKATLPTCTRTGTHLLYLGDPPAIVQPEGGGEELRVTRDVRSSNWSPIDACLEADGRLFYSCTLNVALR